MIRQSQVLYIPFEVVDRKADGIKELASIKSLTHVPWTAYVSISVIPDV